MKIKPEFALEKSRIGWIRSSKDHRLKKTDDFSSVFDFRKLIRSKHFLLHYRQRTCYEIQAARLGLIVAKKFLYRSVDRNLIKRLAREQFRCLHNRLPARDFVLRLSVKPDVVNKKALAEEIYALLSKTIAPE